MRRDSEPIGGTGLLLLGGGARAAYAVGFLRCLARRLPDGHHFSAILGISSGAINAAYLASRPGSFQDPYRPWPTSGKDWSPMPDAHRFDHSGSRR